MLARLRRVPFGAQVLLALVVGVALCFVAREMGTGLAAPWRDPGAVTPVTTAAYGAGKQLAPRPQHSGLDLARLRATGFVPEDASVALHRYLAG